MTTKTILRATVSLALAVALGACGDDGPPPADGPPTTEVFTESSWTIETPAGWTRSDVTKDADAKEAIRYGSAGGEYFIVHLDPTGSDFAYDALWRYEVTGSQFEIVEKYECKGKQDESCRPDDARYDGYILWKGNADPPKVGGHTWYFAFGSTTAATIDPAAFEQIAESIRVTS